MTYSYNVMLRSEEWTSFNSAPVSCACTGHSHVVFNFVVLELTEVEFRVGWVEGTNFNCSSICEVIGDFVGCPERPNEVSCVVLSRRNC